MVAAVHGKELNEVFTAWKSSDTTRFAAVSHRLPILVVQLWALQHFLLLMSCCLSVFSLSARSLSPTQLPENGLLYAVTL